MTITYGYCPLDKRWFIGINSTTGQPYNSVWVWFYLGHKIKNNFTKKYWILPYEPSYYRVKKVVRIQIKSTSADNAGKRIYKIIQKITKLRIPKGQ